MRNHILTLASAFAVAVLMFGCTPDQVAPKSNDNALAEAGIMGDNGPHYTLSPICSSIDELSLASATGSFTVGGTTTPWGSMQIFNGKDMAGNDMLETKYSLAYNWYISEVAYFFGDISVLQIGPNGVPIIDASWTTSGVNPVLNTYSEYTELNTLPSKNTLVARIEVGQMDWVTFDGSLDASTVQYLWVWNDQFSNTGSARESASPLHMPWQTAPCPVSVEKGSKEINF